MEFITLPFLIMRPKISQIFDLGTLEYLTIVIASNASSSETRVFYSLLSHCENSNFCNLCLPLPNFTSNYQNNS